jgi:hypothetical protein
LVFRAVVMSQLETLILTLFLRYPEKEREFNHYMIEHLNDNPDRIDTFCKFWDEVDHVLSTAIRREAKCMLAVSS